MQVFARHHPINALERLKLHLKYKTVSTTAAKETLVVIDLYGVTPEDLIAHIQSPNYPDAYPNATRFTWLFRTSFRYRLRFEIEHFELESCCGDKLTVHDGGSFLSPYISVLPGTIASGRTPSVHTSTNSTLLIHFESGSSAAVGGAAAAGFRGFVRVIWDLVLVKIAWTVENIGFRTQEVTSDVIIPLSALFLSFDGKVGLPYGSTLYNLGFRPIFAPGLLVLIIYLLVSFR